MATLRPYLSEFLVHTLLWTLLLTSTVVAQTEKPPLHGRHWMAITGKPLAATAGAKMFERGGNAVDAACAMLAASATMFDDVSWGGETQALIYNPRLKKVVGINACGVAPTGATPEYFRGKRMRRPPDDGPLAAITPGNAGGLLTMLAEYGTLSLKEVLAPAMEMADGFPIEAELASKIQSNLPKLKRWPYSKRLFVIHPNQEREGPHPGEIFRQADLLITLQKLVDAEKTALAKGKSRSESIYAAYDRFYRGDIAREFIRGSREQGGLHTMEDLDQWEVKIEEPAHTNYKGIEVYKLTTWTQGPVMLQCLNLLESFNLESMSYNTARYIHTLYQVMNHAYADRDFYYGDPYLPPEEPIEGLLSKAYARRRMLEIDWNHNDPLVGPGNPYPFEDKDHPFPDLLKNWALHQKLDNKDSTEEFAQTEAEFERAFRAGTTSIQAADIEGWAVSITPSGGWMPACIAGETGIGMSQRMQSFVMSRTENPFNVLTPGQRPRVTLTPSLALKENRPLLCFSMQGGDMQDQSLLQFFLNVVEFGMTVQEACEAANFTSYQLRSSFGRHDSKPGRLTLNSLVPPWVQKDLLRKGYRIDLRDKTAGPITAIFFDWDKNSLWGGVSNDGEDHGIAW